MNSEEQKITTTPQIIHQQLEKKKDMMELVELLKIIKLFKKNKDLYDSLFMCDSCYSIYHKTHDYYTADNESTIICKECYENEQLKDYKDNYTQCTWTKDSVTGLYC